MVSNQLVVYTLARVLLCVVTANALYFRYACKPNGDISAINPDSTKYKHAYAFNKLGNCQAEIVNNDTVIKVKNCPKGENAEIINIILNTKTRPFFLIGGRDGKTVSASCSLEKNSYLDRVQISMSAQGLFRGIFGFPPDFYERPPNVSIEMFDVTGEPGYNVFTISYPIGVVITGPPESDILPEVCTAYSSNEVGKGLSAVILKNGCSMEHRLMFSFSTEEANWFDRDIDIDEDFTRFVLDGGVHDVMVNGEEELPPPPKVFTNAYAFRFYLSNYLSIHCEVRICPSGKIGCKLPCDTVTPTTPPQPTASEEPEPEAVPEPEVNNEVNDAMKSADEGTDDKDTTSSPVIAEEMVTIPTAGQNTAKVVQQGTTDTPKADGDSKVHGIDTTKASSVTVHSSTIPEADNKASTTPRVYIDVAASTEKVKKEALTTEKPRDQGSFGRRRRGISRNVKLLNDLDLLSVRKRRSIVGDQFILGKEFMKRPHIMMDIIIVGPDEILNKLDEMDDHLKISNEMVGSELPIDAEGASRVTSLVGENTPMDGGKDPVDDVSLRDNDNKQVTETTETKLSSNIEIDIADGDQSSHTNIMSTTEHESESYQVVLDNAAQPIFDLGTKKVSDGVDPESTDDLKPDKPREKENGPSNELNPDKPEANENVPSNELNPDTPREKEHVPFDELNPDKPKEKENVPSDELKPDKPREKENVPSELKPDKPKEKENVPSDELNPDKPEANENVPSNELNLDTPREKEHVPSDELNPDKPREKGRVPSDELNPDKLKENENVPTDDLNPDKPREKENVPSDELNPDKPREKENVPSDQLNPDKLKENENGNRIITLKSKIHVKDKKDENVSLLLNQ